MKIFDYAIFVNAKNMKIPKDLLFSLSNNPLMVVIIGGCNSEVEESIKGIWSHHPNISFIFPCDSNKYSFLNLAKEILITKEMMDFDNVIKNLDQKPYKVLG